VVLRVLRAFVANEGTVVIFLPEIHGLLSLCLSTSGISSANGGEKIFFLDVT